MGEKVGIPSIKDRVRKAIDMDEWQHSWHLPRNGSGSIDWYSIETYAEVRKIIQAKMVDADARLTFLGTLCYDEIDWSHPLEQLKDELRTVEYCILQNDLAPGETIQDFQDERKKLEATLEKYEPILGDENSISRGVKEKN